MATAIESMTGISITSPFFGSPVTLDFFPIHSKPHKKNRVALVYGANGSGKTTIAQGFKEYIDSTHPKTVELYPVSGSSLIKISPGGKAEKFFVFDESYIIDNIKIQEDGLETIVLFGPQIKLDDQIKETRLKLTTTEARINSQTEICQKYNNKTYTESPQYWSSRITDALKATDGWAEYDGMRIKGKQIKTRITDSEIERLGKLIPSNSETDAIDKFNSLFEVYISTQTTTVPIANKVPTITFPSHIITQTKSHLQTIPQTPTLTDREQELLDLFGVGEITTAKDFLSDTSNNTCHMCLQPISKQHRKDILEKIEHILNKEIENLRIKLKATIIDEIQSTNFQSFNILDHALVEKITLQINFINTLIAKHNSYIEEKINNPFVSIEYDLSDDIEEAYIKLSCLLLLLEQKRSDYNKVIADKKKTKEQLIILNDEIAHYSIAIDYSTLLSQKEAKKKNDDKLTELEKEKSELLKELQELNSKRENVQIAVEQINHSLAYIFCNVKRLELSLESDHLYHLKSNNHEVSPKNISCGERNALALCYFFTQIARETDSRNLYCDEMCLIIDDPVSSFDLENRIGILSFLRHKFYQILSACVTTKILIMTHDISVLYDLNKAIEEISDTCSSIGKSAEFIMFKLYDKKLNNFEYKRHNEYTRLMQQVYEFACNPTEERELSIGNITRRVLEAFSTFSYKKGIAEVHFDPLILNSISNIQMREYFQNSMYRLVLNTESHFEEAIKCSPEASFYSHLSVAEKQRTAKDILCFMYIVNPVHVVSHLTNAERNIKSWLSDIEKSCPK